MYVFDGLVLCGNASQERGRGKHIPSKRGGGGGEGRAADPTDQTLTFIHAFSKYCASTVQGARDRAGNKRPRFLPFMELNF